SIGDLSSWNTSNVTDMYQMFSYAGYRANNFILNLSSWKTYNVTIMNMMFQWAGSGATTWSVTIPQTNGNGISNTTDYWYGESTSVYAIGNRSFTLAQ
ncbi:BspA family leucine-rich repeat surface protein, partial [Candidatus Saccharibacteria bacterium]|nr:BspA family leucine-rich repeat surface protein [Candidatus Saccharibacteria bacterium]